MKPARKGVAGAADKNIDPFIVLFSVTLFISAGLTFTIQPMIGKMLLPFVGGAPSGWLVTMVYFQFALLAGYFIAHLLSRLSALEHMIAVTALLLAGTFAFPLSLDGTIIESGRLPEAFGVLLVLFLGLTLPCVALFTLSPSLQRLFDSVSQKNARDPYFLFAASNIGSLSGLLLYPLVIERKSGLQMQAYMWQTTYAILIALCVLCALLAWWQASKSVGALNLPARSATGWKARARWVMLAFIPSSLMLGITAYITTDVGSVPFFWVMPLALYLLTFILAFARKPIVTPAGVAFFQTATVALFMAFFIKAAAMFSSSQGLVIPLIAFFLTALLCHSTLAAERPEAEKLTDFYLWGAIGGALGGSFNTFVAPFIFPLPVEFLLVLLASCLIHKPRACLAEPKLRRSISIALVLAAVTGTLYAINLVGTLANPLVSLLTLVVLIVSLVILSFSPRWLFGVSLVFAGLTISTNYADLLDVHRDFFGVIRIFEKHDTKNGIWYRSFFHGSTLHGLEEVKPHIDITPNSYYDVGGPLNDLMAAFKPSSVGIVGMGAGTTLCYRAPGRRYTVYEIDPFVPWIASKWFDYTRLCGMPELHVGDGRRMLAASDEQYDLLTVDAFTSDAIPLHLLTEEAFKVYMDHLKSHGVLAIHISNRFYDLRQPIANVVAALGLSGLTKLYAPPPSRPLASKSRWVAVARDAKELEPLRREGWEALPAPNGRAWTDDFSDALSSLKILQPEKEEDDAQTH